jgi:hypothetical protein
MRVRFFRAALAAFLMFLRAEVLFRWHDFPQLDCLGSPYFYFSSLLPNSAKFLEEFGRVVVDEMGAGAPPVTTGSDLGRCKPFTSFAV